MSACVYVCVCECEQENDVCQSDEEMSGANDDVLRKACVYTVYYA